MSWVCKTCSSNNEDANSICDICGSDRPAAEPVRITAEEINSKPTSVCTLTAKRVRDLGLTGDVVVPKKFNVIGEGAFENMTHVTSVTLHADVLKISERAFAGCVSLKRVYCEGELDYVGSKAFANCVSLSAAYRPKAKRTASDAYATMPRPDSYLKSKSGTVSAPSPAPAPSTSSAGGSSDKSPKSGGVLSEIGLTLVAIGLFTLLFSIGWQWGVGILSCFVIAVVLVALDELVIFSNISAYLSISASAVFVINLILLLIFKESYLIISSILNVANALFSAASMVCCFNDGDDGFGVWSIIVGCLNVATLVGALILL